MQLSKFKIFFIYALCLSSFASLASDEYVVTIKEHKFIPDKLYISANKKIKLVVYNQDAEVEEFESFDLRREKIIPANGHIKLNIGPLEPGEYKIFGDFHSDTALGIIIVK